MSSLFNQVLPVARAIISTLAGSLIVLAAGPAYSSDSTPLTLEKAQSLALSRSRQLAAQDFSVQAWREMAVAAGQLPDPVLKMGIDNLPVTGADRYSLTDDGMTMRRVALMQELTGTNKRTARTDLAEREADKARAEKTMAIAAIERDTALAWLDSHYAQKMASIIDEQVAQSRLEIAAAENAYRAGRGNQADIFAAKGSLVLMQDRADEIRQRIHNAGISLSRWVGPEANTTLADPPLMTGIHLDAQHLQTQLEQHPQIAVLDQQVSIARADANLARSNQSADWSVELAYQQRGAPNANMISVEVSIPLQWDRKNRQNRELFAKQAKFEQASAERDEQLRLHVAEMQAMIFEWQNNRARLDRYEAELLPLAAQRTGSVVAGYRGGKASLADVLSARRNELDVHLQSLQLQSETARLWAQLEFLSPAAAGVTLNRELP